MRQSAKEYPSFQLENRLYIRLGLYSRGKTFHTPSEEKEDSLGLFVVFVFTSAISPEQEPGERVGIGRVDV